jgi:hypothetical protein
MVKDKVSKQTHLLHDEGLFRPVLGATDCALYASGLHYTALPFSFIKLIKFFVNANITNVLV